MMCRAFLIMETERGRVDEAKFQIVLNYVVNAKNSGNKDGYYLSVDGDSFRTLDYDKYLEFVINHESAINEAKVVAGHLRLATAGEVIEKWVHGWKFGNYECYHNGCLHEWKENDSYEFFEKVKKFQTNRVVKVANENSGWGVFMMVNAKGNKYVLSQHTDINVHLVNDHFFAINSNEDVHDLKSEVELESKVEHVAKGILVFDRNTERKIVVGNYVFSDLKQSYNDCVIKFDRSNQPVEVAQVETGYSYGGMRTVSYSDNSAEHDWFDEEDERKEKKKKKKRKRNKKKKKLTKKEQKKVASVIGQALEENYWQGYKDGYAVGQANKDLVNLDNFDEKKKLLERLG